MNKKIVKLFFDGFVIIFCVVFPHMGLLPMYVFPFVILLFLWFYLKLYKQDFTDIGVKISDLNYNSFIIGSTLGLFYAVFTWFIIGPIFKLLGVMPANVSDLNFIKHNFINYIFLLLTACFLVIPYEEIIFRGFILNRSAKSIANKKWAPVISVLLSSVLFALYHYQEGTGAVINIFIFSLFISWLYYASNKNIWYAIFFHIMYDIVMLTTIYYGYM